MTVDLYIRGIKADIGIMKDFVRNFKRTLQFSDLANPVSITTDYTYSATLPGTDVNKAIFGYIENGTQPMTFNPAARYEFILNVNGVLWLHGDVKLDKVSIKSGETNFSCSFFSRVHEKIVALGKKDLKDLTSLAQNNYFFHLLDRESLADFWIAAHEYSDTIRYVPCRAGMYNDFQNDKMMIPKFNSSDPPQITGYGVAELGSDYDEYATREYRVEYQRPALSIRQLIAGIMSDNGITVDASLLQSPYVSNGWLMCPQLVTEATTEDCYGGFGTLSMTTTTTSPGFNVYGMYQTSASPVGTFSGTTVHTDDNPHLVSVEFCIKLRARAQWSQGMQAYLPYGMSELYVTRNAEVNQPHMYMRLAGSGISMDSASVLIPMSWPATSLGNGIPWRIEDTKYAVYQPRTGVSGWEEPDWMPVKLTFALDVATHANKNFALDFFFDRLAYTWYSDPTYTGSLYTGSLDQMEIFVKPITDCTPGDITRLKDKGFTGETLSYTTQTTGWSPLNVDVNMILSQELSQRDFLTDITKMTGCIWDLQRNGDIDIKTRNNYFEGYEILDWDGKLDRKSEIEITPIPYDKGVYTLSYKDGDSLLENQYKSKVGLDWAKQYVNTNYQFNSDTESLYESGRYNTVMAKGQRQTVVLNSSYQGVMHKMQPYEIPMIETKDNGSPKEGFRYLMDCGLQTLQKAEEVYITQDSSWMDSDYVGGRCWYDTAHYSSAPAIGNNIAILSAIPLFCTRRNDATFDWAKSEVSFSGETDESYPSSIALYPRFWGSYIGELYNARTRVMTAWFNLSMTDLLNYRFKDFVSVNNSIWHVNKIIDFDLSGESLTKCELVEVHDIDAWVNGQDWNFYTPVNKNGGNGKYAEPLNVQTVADPEEEVTIPEIEPDIEENNE